VKTTARKGNNAARDFLKPFGAGREECECFVRTLVGCALVLASLITRVAAPIVVLSDSFDTYTTGTALSGQGGWTATRAGGDTDPGRRTRRR